MFNGSPVIEAKVDELIAAARAELATIEALGGAVEAIGSGYMKERLVESNAARLAAIESGEKVVVGVNAHTETADSPLTGGSDSGFLMVGESAEADQLARLAAWREGRDGAAVEAALDKLSVAAAEGRNIMEPSIAPRARPTWPMRAWTICAPA